MRSIVGVLLIFLFSQAEAQIPEIPITTYKYDTSYITNFGNLLAVRLVSPRRTYNFRLKNRNTKDLIDYRPNLQSAFGLGFTYRWLAVDFVFNPKWNRSKTQKFGETNEFNVKGSIYLERHMVDVQFRTYKGLHITNPQDYLNPWDGTFPYRPDIRTTNFLVSYSIPSNYTKYSPKTTFQLDGRMKKSAGSIMYVSTFHISTLNADSSLLPIEYEPSFDPQAQITKMGFVYLKQSLGYAYTFIYKKFYLTLSGMPGLSLALGAAQTEVEKYNVASLNFMLSSKAGIGFNSRKWYTGVYFIYDYQNTKLTNDLAYNINLGELRFFIGYRIKAPYLVNTVISN